jgi:hypothetical protein
MATLSELQNYLDALEKQKSSGVARISYAGKSIEYRTIADINSAIKALENQINEASGVKKKSQTRKTYASKGL